MEEYLSVEEAKQRLFNEIAEEINFKLLKNGTMKRKINNLVFEILFYSSKWNASYESVEINAEFRLKNTKYGKLSIDNTLAYMEFVPEEGYWFDISTMDRLEEVKNKLLKSFNENIVDLANRFEENYIAAVEYLFYEGYDKYHVHLDYIAEELGVDAVRDKAKMIYEGLSDEQKQQVEQYKSGARNMAWMLNRNNLKYIVDNELI